MVLLPHVVASSNAELSAEEKEDKKGHHVGHHLPAEEMEKFLAKARGRAQAYKKLDETNKGHQLLRKMGWKEGQGLGARKRGIAQPIEAEQRMKGVGIGAEPQAMDVTSNDDIYSQYKKRMALSYKFRPNPMVRLRACVQQCNSCREAQSQH